MELNEIVNFVVKEALTFVWINHKLSKKFPHTKSDKNLAAFKTEFDAEHESFSRKLEEMLSSFEKSNEITIPKELIENLGKVVWIESFLTWPDWKKFFEMHLFRMTSSPKLYANFLFFACYAVNEQLQGVYNCFIGTLSVVARFALYASENGHHEFKDVSDEIFTAFFKKEMSLKCDESFLNELNSHVQSRESLCMYEKVSSNIEDEKWKLVYISEFLIKDLDEEKIKLYVLEKSIRNQLEGAKREIVETHDKAVSLAEETAVFIGHIYPEPTAFGPKPEEIASSPQHGASSASASLPPPHPELEEFQMLELSQDLLRKMLVDIEKATSLIKKIFKIDN